MKSETKFDAQAFSDLKKRVERLERESVMHANISMKNRIICRNYVEVSNICRKHARIFLEWYELKKGKNEKSKK